MRSISLLGFILCLPSLSYAQTAPAWKSYQATGNPADMIRSTAVAAALGTKVDTANGTSANQILSAPVISSLKAFSSQGSNNITAHPVGIGNRTVQSTLYANETAVDGSTSIWPHVIQTTSSTGYGVTDPIWGGEADRINLFVGAQCLAGSSSCWAENQMFYAGPGFQATGHGIEIDMENASSDRDPSVSGTKSIVGAEITGLTAYPISFGLDIVGGGTWAATGNSHVAHNGIGIMGGAAIDNSFIDVGDATESLHIIGNHGIGLDLSYATITGSAIVMDSTHALNFHNKGTGNLYNGLTSDGSTVILGAQSPSNNIGYGGAGGYAFLNVSNNVTGATTLFSAGSASDINLVLSAKGNGAVVATTPLQAPSVSVTTKMTVPVVAAAPAGACTAGQMEVSGTGFHVCVAGAWKTATLQ
ncbi:hypothetical protein [Acetobacter vaccinii]|uniref:Uncharacterized protein n=1 Tax=Acetobacter vaccinii TaxID=2592655 RepID=A0A5C1YQN0_9PROT|nr:hypothetical protein [Acetobacter vaccinii]QEO17868.1 hypothetical protein FLP30_09085 [Acetobacter vaccinii]